MIGCTLELVYIQKYQQCITVSVTNERVALDYITMIDVVCPWNRALFTTMILTPEFYSDHTIGRDNTSSRIITSDSSYHH